jgi:hypothetical protein
MMYLPSKASVSPFIIVGATAIRTMKVLAMIINELPIIFSIFLLLDLP